MKRIIYDYENPHIVGKASRSFPLAKIIISIIVIFFAIALIYILFFRKPSYKLESKEYFSVVSGEYESETEASRAAEEIKSRGGGGYVAPNGKYEVVVAVYDNRDDADAIATRYGYIIKDLGRYTLGADLDDAELSRKALKLCVFPEQIFDSVYETLNSIGKGELSADAAEYSLEQLSETLSQKHDELKVLIEKYPSDKLLLSADEMYERLFASATEAKQAGYTVSVRLRYWLIELTYIYKNFLITIS